MIEFKEYNEIIQQWLQGVLDSYRKDAELTLKYCNKLIEYGMHNNDVKILGYAYYHLSGTYYCLNDGDKFFDTTYKALEYLELSKQWDFAVRFLCPLKSVKSRHTMILYELCRTESKKYE